MSAASNLLTYVERHRAALDRLADLSPNVERAATLLLEALRGGGKLLTCGNGGSAADAQHFAAELTGRYRRERRPLPAIALTTDSSALTCIGNDYAFADVFSRQVEALAGERDVVVGITTSGNSENVVRALAAAKARGARAVALCGERGGRVEEFADVTLKAPSALTAHTQEMHILLIHVLCETIDDAFVDERIAEQA
ncbi:D-sedoheptulose-7-phosphate isomerase [Deinococcus yavapaiensis]|uniref:Phosphoheptose isomerase n=1 Tax=Deinococcus yavapaiensis KR-236 TaxID=694435 RepID=A0A318S833_9DEIO|nr:SIS domain-containing protein [Deinococcus yavapaiensis]PYE54612.1 phosphoheptose isomerase [Deinococcus yavapaiensis KR-236]